MKNTLTLAVALSAAAWTPASAGFLPDGWFAAGTRPQNYDMGVDAVRAKTGKACGYIRSKPGAGEGFGTLMQTYSAEDFRGKRLRLSAHVAAKDVGEWAGLWMRVDGANRNVLAFDNMQDRPIRGTDGWRSYDVVLDVPRGAAEISFGLLLHGAGTVWLDDVSFELVPDSVLTTDNKQARLLPRRAVHLGFEP
jgi:hypothetical protein